MKVGIVCPYDWTSPGGVKACHMRDQGVERRPALGRVDFCNRLRRRRVRAEAVDRLRRKGDQPARAQDARSVRDAGRVGPENAGGQ